MKRIYYILSLAFLVYSLTLYAARVPSSKAMMVANQIIAHKAPSESLKQGYQVMSIQTDVEGDGASYFIAKLSPKGFILIAGEDNVYPVLAYSFDQNFADGPLPENIASWIQSYKDQIAYHRTAGTMADTKILNAWEEFSAEKAMDLKEEIRGVEPLLISTWDQGNYYNGLCPQDAGGPGGRVYAGCVATAMAQVMYYYRHPQTGSGSSSYFHPDYGVQSANYGNTTYRWEEMLNFINKPNDAVAELLYHCGVAVEMGYSAGGSGAYSSDAASALRSYFGYSNSTQLVNKSDYSEQGWNDLLKAQLDAGQPMYYHGYGSGGHAFNVDGYQGDDHFHFNWGWSGSYNGYFYLTDLNPGGSNFSNGQGAIINIIPTGVYPAFCTGSHTLTAIEGTFEDGSGPIADYQANANCSWLIAPQQNPEDSISSITINFDRFDTERQDDWIAIHEGNSSADPIIAKYSGDSLPGSLTVEGNQMFITFISNDSNQSAGFSASYSSTIPNYCTKNPEIYTDSLGFITDGSGAKNYANRSICHWIIEPENAGAVVLTFTEFETESLNDFVEVYSYQPLTGSGTLLGRYSGNTLPPVLSSNTGAIFITFFTNSTQTKGGWKAFYSASAVGMEEQDVDKFKAYPNPANDKLFVTFARTNEDNSELYLRDINGREVIHQNINQGSQESMINTSEISTGLYFLEISDGDRILRKKILIQR